MSIGLRSSKSTSGRWIGSGSEVDYHITWLLNSLTEVCVCRSCRVVVGVWGANSVQSQLDGIFRSKAVYQRVANMQHVTVFWALCTNCHEFKFIVRTQSK